MSKFLYFLFVLLICLNNLQARNLCDKANTTIGFFNGVLNSEEQARKNQEELEKKIKLSDLDIDYEKVSYSVFYNYSRGILDFVELYQQNLEEADKLLAENKEETSSLKDNFQYFFEFIGTKRGNWTNQIKGVRKNIILTISSSVALAYIKNLTARNYKKHEIEIEVLAAKGDKFMFVAHSQGNLFANNAYKYAINQKGYSDKSVKVLHISPVSKYLNGERVLLDIDIVAKLYPERITDKFDYIYNKKYKNNLLNLHHSFIDVYLNEDLKVINPRTTNLLESIFFEFNKAFNSLEEPNIEEKDKTKKGFFTALLKWDGTGDVDLHVFEPDGWLVNAWNKRGGSGELDKDDKIGFGPEHYHSTCNSDELQEGIYKMAVLNHKCFGSCERQEFRTATLSISDNSGVITSSSVILGNDKYLNRGFYLIDLNISKDIVTNKYSVQIVNNKPRLITDFINKEK